MELSDVKRTWDTFAKRDPLWDILTDPDKRGGRWDEDEFFATGEREVAEVLAHIASLGLELGKEMALDFGCGVGRLTQAMAGHFHQCYGVDISPTMIELANRYNRFGDRARYILNERDDLSCLDNLSFDFIYSSITLQHMQPRYSLNYIKEFLRLLKPEGYWCSSCPQSEFWMALSR